MVIVFFISLIAAIGAILYLLNKRYPIAGPFEVSNLVGRVIAVSILVAAAIMAVQRMSE